MIAVVIYGRWNTMQLQPKAGSTRPLVRRCSVTLDLSSPAPLTGSHDWRNLASLDSSFDRTEHTLESFVTVMFVDEDIIY